MKMKPDFIKKKETIYLVAPSFGAFISPYKERLKQATLNLKRYGFNIIEGKNIHLNDGVVASNTPEKRAEEIHEAFLSDAKAIISVGGGEMMIEMLEYIDFNIIKNNPKWYMGFSDNTNLTYTIATICDIETIYGINAPSFCLYPFTYDAKDSLSLLMGNNKLIGYKSWQYEDLDESPIHPYRFDKRTRIIPVNYSPLQGRIIGGCLDCLVGLCGTKYDNTVNYINKHKDEGVIFFMEACDLNSISLRRALIQLRDAGWFDNVSGFVIGRSNNYYDESFGQTMNQSYVDILSRFNKPILLDCPIGHRAPTLPIRVGALAKVTLDDNLIIEYLD